MKDFQFSNPVVTCYEPILHQLKHYDFIYMCMVWRKILSGPLLTTDLSLFHAESVQKSSLSQRITSYLFGRLGSTVHVAGRLLMFAAILGYMLALTVYYFEIHVESWSVVSTICEYLCIYVYTMAVQYILYLILLVHFSNKIFYYTYPIHTHTN